MWLNYEEKKMVAPKEGRMERNTLFIAAATFFLVCLNNGGEMEAAFEL